MMKGRKEETKREGKSCKIWAWKGKVNSFKDQEISNSGVRGRALW